MDDIVVIQYNFDKIKPKELRESFDTIKESLTGVADHIIALPDFVTFSKLGLEDLVQIRDRLTEYIDAIKSLEEK